MLIAYVEITYGKYISSDKIVAEVNTCCENGRHK